MTATISKPLKFLIREKKKLKAIILKPLKIFGSLLFLCNYLEDYNGPYSITKRIENFVSLVIYF